MGDHNRLHLIGRLTKDPIFRPATHRSKPRCLFTLAVNRVVANEQGPQADYFPCVLWGEEALRFVEIRAKGDEVGVLGRIRTSYVPQANGQAQFRWEVRVDQIFYGRRSLKNLSPKNLSTPAVKAVGHLAQEFSKGLADYE